MMIEPTLLAGLGGAALGYAGLLRRRRLRRHEASGEPSRAERGRFVAGLLALAIALSGPIDDAAAESLVVHMVQHQLLVLVAAPLLATSGVLRLVQEATGRRFGAGRLGAAAAPSLTALTAVAAAAIHLAILLAWHVPAAYDAALRSDPIHHLEHVSMLVSAVLAWAAMLRASRDDRAMPGALVAFALLAVGGAGLGIVLLTAPGSLYTTYLGAPVDDQRIAGALMKVGALVVYVGAAVGATLRWLGRLDVADHTPVSGRQP